MTLLRVEGLRKRYGDTDVLRGIDLSVDAHDVVCVIGSSGSGKSTLLRCINLLEVVDDGAVWLEDREITDPRVDADEVRRHLGMVFQSYNLFPHLSVLDNVTLGPRFVVGTKRGEAEAQAHELLRRFSLEDKADAYPDRLSGGQQQRVAVVRALAMDPHVLLLDEITSALDPELVGEVLEIIRDLATQGMTIVMATHEMAFARDVADRVVFLDGGRVEESGTPAQVFESPSSARTAEFLRRFLAT
ncbi:amino acid ABC transporter ATP-binding protein [Solicola gregarius]|uniref:Amino acid ABC transporter ATP-binding protein n=1 Tax=Solicola gregarius TaxID=2908642 RepID=A0AA46YLQ7_9ACTN|nr:amino acid ABC transporter ATP-binding protein [Solicola gregarius]UYM07200.1 amino acid ABC transporter ATP-binding protein [Solicola gregarius]